MKITSGDIVLTIVLILFIAAMITFSGCSHPEPVEPNTQGFVAYEIDGEKVRLYIDSDAESVSVCFDKGYIHTVTSVSTSAITGHTYRGALLRCGATRSFVG